MVPTQLRETNQRGFYGRREETWKNQRDEDNFLSPGAPRPIVTQDKAGKTRQNYNAFDLLLPRLNLIIKKKTVEEDQ